MFHLTPVHWSCFHAQIMFTIEDPSYRAMRKTTGLNPHDNMLSVVSRYLPYPPYSDWAKKHQKYKARDFFTILPPATFFYCFTILKCHFWESVLLVTYIIRGVHHIYHPMPLNCTLPLPSSLKAIENSSGSVFLSCQVLKLTNTHLSPRQRMYGYNRGVSCHIPQGVANCTLPLPCSLKSHWKT